MMDSPNGTTGMSRAVYNMCNWSYVSTFTSPYEQYYLWPSTAATVPALLGSPTQYDLTTAINSVISVLENFPTMKNAITSVSIVNNYASINLQYGTLNPNDDTGGSNNPTFTTIPINYAKTGDIYDFIVNSVINATLQATLLSIFASYTYDSTIFEKFANASSIIDNPAYQPVLKCVCQFAYQPQDITLCTAKGYSTTGPSWPGGLYTRSTQTLAAMTTLYGAKNLSTIDYASDLDSLLNYVNQL